MQKIKKHPLRNRKIWFLIIPSLIGMSAFYFIPAAVSLFYAFTDATGGFAGFVNFTDLMSNTAFRLASRNSLLFIAASLTLTMTISFILAQALQKLPYRKTFMIAFMLPLIIPSGAVVFFWNALFADNGAINSILIQYNMPTVPWLATSWSFWVILVVFLFKNIGFNLVLFMAGFQFIPGEYYEVARMEGAGVFSTFRHVTFIYIIPTTFLVFMMSIINSFRIFREIYLLYGQYPHQDVYMLQHFMNNQFIFANMQRLSATATILSAGVVILVIGVFAAQRKITDTFG